MAVALREGSGGCEVEGGIWWLSKLRERSGGGGVEGGIL